MPLPRILEPEVMDTGAEARTYDEMDHAKVNQQFVADLLAFANDKESFHDILDAGTGTAQIAVELCLQNLKCRVMAMDLSASMLDLAVYRVEAHGLRDRITLAQADAGNMVFDDNMFDGVVSNSLIHHLPQPLNCLKEIVRVASQDGIVFVRDLLRPADEENLEALVETYAGDESDQAQQLLRQSLHAALTVEEMRSLVITLGLAAESVQQTSDRHWTWAVSL